MSDENKVNEFMKALNLEDVASVSAGGVSLSLRSAAEKTQAEKSAWELETERRRAAYNPLFFANWNDRNQRR